jgi:aspartyl-tRNA(Asn)/glutamyl-tRNA(Gln) amidotransferase subunit A
MTVDPVDLTVDVLAAGYADGSISPVEVVQDCLARIDRLDPLLNAFVLVDAERALAEARASADRWQRGEQRGPLDGVPATVKDLPDVSGWPTRKGSPHAAADVAATQDSPVSARLREAGCVLLGKTTLPEQGWTGAGHSPLTGITRNPWDPSLTTGGSSAGAGAAAATGMGVLHVGTDGGGSIRMPSSFCGVVGLKPTFAIVPIHPPAGSGLLSHVGPMARTARDAAWMMSVIAQPDPREAYPALRDDRSWLAGIDDGVAGLRIAYAPLFPRAVVDPQVADSVADTVRLLADHGAHVDELDVLALGLPDCHDAFLTLWDAGVGRALADVPVDRLAQSDPGLVATWERAQRISALEYLAADRVRAEATLAMSSLLDRYDVLVSPTMPDVAFAAGEALADPATQQHWIDWTPFTYPINMTRNPAASVPVGLSAEGLPIGMQVVGRHYDDRLVLRVAWTVEQVHPIGAPQLS